VAAVALLGGHADAHFRLEAPPAATMQDGQGSPQKTAPCGPNGSGTPTGELTTYQAGDTITVTIDERIYHPGHYRVALAINDPSELPAAPPITPSMNDECASTVIQNPPVFPVLADGELAHSSPFNPTTQSFQVTLPSDVTCTNCTLQVIQYMSSHGAPCFYYHCANIAIQDEPVMTGGGGMGGASTTSTTTSSGSGGMGAGAGGNSGAGAGNAAQPIPQFGETDEGCDCSAAGTRTSSRSGLALLGLGLLFGARRQRRR
jgi:MYXO-CTERM domain-containing protein